VVGVDEALALPWQVDKPDEDQLEFFRTQTERNLRGAAGWPIHRPDLDPSRIVEKTITLSDSMVLLSLR
jgi:hypothetical protein